MNALSFILLGALFLIVAALWVVSKILEKDRKQSPWEKFYK